MGIKTSCNHSRQLYLLCKGSNDINLIKYYKQYSKILSRIITEVKRAKYNNMVTTLDIFCVCEPPEDGRQTGPKHVV
jgi:hypothetical protein